jgi:hypothetical protein
MTVLLMYLMLVLTRAEWMFTLQLTDATGSLEVLVTGEAAVIFPRSALLLELNLMYIAACDCGGHRTNSWVVCPQVTYSTLIIHYICYNNEWIFI